MRRKASTMDQADSAAACLLAGALIAHPPSAALSAPTYSTSILEAGEACAAFHDEHVRDVKAKRLQCDVREPLPHGCAKHRMVHLREDPQDAEDDPALAAGVTDRLWSMEDVVALTDARETTPAKRGP